MNLRVLAFALPVLALHCSDESLQADASVESESESESETESETESESETELPSPSPVPSLAARGFHELRAIVHLHSAFSHDACDDAGLAPDGTPNWDCIHRMKRALCAEHIAIAFMTDHPAHMREQPFGVLLYAEPPADDEILTNDAGDPIAVRIACDAGEGGPAGTPLAGKVTLLVGAEGTHTMPIGLERHLDPPERYGVALEDTTPAADIDAMIAAVRAAGGFVAIAHSEERELSAATIIAHDLAAMELYNFHANFVNVLGTNVAAALGDLDPFADPTAAVPAPDLAALAMLASYPEPALDKWRAVSAARAITAFAGSDVHENGTLPALCANPDVCEGLVADYPNMVRALQTGGPLMLGDGERIDSYARVFRWVQNRLWVSFDAPGADTARGAIDALESAFQAGRNVVVFEVLGDAPGVALVARDRQGTVIDMGQTVHVADGATLYATLPSAPIPGRTATWSDGRAAAMEATVWRTDLTGTTAIATSRTPGATLAVPLSAAGSYHLEVTLVPHHLTTALGPAAALAERTYRWVETNAIRVAP